LDIPIITAGPIIDVDVHAEAAVKFLIVNNINVADVLIAQDLDVAQRFESVAKDNGLCLNSTVLAHNFGYLILYLHTANSLFYFVLFLVYLTWKMVVLGI